MNEEYFDKRESMRRNSINILKDKGVAHKMFTLDHYQVGEYDFKPSTGEFVNIKTREQGRGVFNLIRKVTNAGRIEAGK